MNTRKGRIAAAIAEMKEKFEARDRREGIRPPTDVEYRRWAEWQLRQQDMAAIKDTSVIPVGYYCYGTSPSGVTGVCPYWSNPKIESPQQAAGINPSCPTPLNQDRRTWFAHCAFLEVDSDYNDEDNSSLIWDQVKECGQNPEPRPTPEEFAAFSKLRDIVHAFMQENEQADHVNVEIRTVQDGVQYVIVRDVSRAARQDGQLKFERDRRADQLCRRLERRINDDRKMVSHLTGGHSVSFTSSRVELAADTGDVGED